jgi:hypothetical protein
MYKLHWMYCIIFYILQVLETELDGLLAAAETLQVKGLSNVRNKYEKGDIQCADNQQNQQQQQEQQQQQKQQQDDQDEKTEVSLQGTPLHLRRKRRKVSESPVSVIYKFRSNICKVNCELLCRSLQGQHTGVLERNSLRPIKVWSPVWIHSIQTYMM